MQETKQTKINKKDLYTLVKKKESLNKLTKVRNKINEATEKEMNNTKRKCEQEQCKRETQRG